MKDMLDREIVVGDTLAYALLDTSLSAGYVGRPYLKTAKVTDMSYFSLRMVDADENANVISDGATYIICAWAE
jgi:hypothetical protein